MLGESFNIFGAAAGGGNSDCDYVVRAEAIPLINFVAVGNASALPSCSQASSTRTVRILNVALLQHTPLM